MSYIGRVMANFVLTPKYSLQGVSDVYMYFNDTIKLLHLENPLFGATIVALFLVLAEF